MLNEAWSWLRDLYAVFITSSTALGHSFTLAAKKRHAAAVIEQGEEVERRISAYTELLC